MRQEFSHDGFTVTRGVLPADYVAEMIGERSHVLFDDTVVVKELVNFLTEVAT